MNTVPCLLPFQCREMNPWREPCEKCAPFAPRRISVHEEVRDVINLVCDDDDDFTTETECDEIDVEFWYKANEHQFEFCNICYETQLEFYQCPNGHGTCDECVSKIKKEDDDMLYFTCPFCKEESVIIPHLQ